MGLTESNQEEYAAAALIPKYMTRVIKEFPSFETHLLQPSKIAYCVVKLNKDDYPHLD
jgi:hypothetical protein